jgi:predicted transposase/invertase (TIGR01784 family)
MLRLFFDKFSTDYEPIKRALLDEKDGQCDVICKLDSGEYVLVEAQVMSEDAQDHRFLAHLSTLHGNQLRRGEKWIDLKDVYAINIMECAFSTQFEGSEPGEYRRHYKMTDLSLEGNPRSLNHLNLIQFSLHDLDLGKVKDVEERWWLDFFKNGHKYDSIPKGCPPPIAAAYEKIRTDALPPAIKSALDIEEGRYVNFQGLLGQKEQEGIQKGIQQGIQQGKQEGKQEVLELLLRNGTISQAAHDSALQDAAASGDSQSETRAPDSSLAPPPPATRKRRQPRRKSPPAVQHTAPPSPQR